MTTSRNISVKVKNRQFLSDKTIAYFRQKVQVAQLSQRDRAAWCVSFGQKWKTGTGRQYFTDIIGLSSQHIKCFLSNDIWSSL